MAMDWSVDTVYTPLVRRLSRYATAILSQAAKRRPHSAAADFQRLTREIARRAGLTLRERS
jgi:hypothetical protein